ncbi:Hypothetical_protein [Hexamita inflata]|uniref:Hypothetical_protein n=1 Tax=Hexamita inflata TaxID=28002 RepID=A0AA86UNA1_9EUKA|nr:Hypothetical protein HINF_LOCUS49514 [Hexamita inflata]
MPSQNSQTQKRATLPKGEQQQVDMEILNYVCDMLQLRGSRLEAVQYFCRNRELIARNKIINLVCDRLEHQHEGLREQRRTPTKIVDSIVPNNLPLYPFERSKTKSKRISTVGEVALRNTIKNMSEAVANNSERNLSKTSKQLFGLKGSRLLLLQKQVDKNRYTPSTRP